MKLSHRDTKPVVKENARTVHFAEHEDVFIIRNAEARQDDLGSSSITGGQQLILGTSEDEDEDDEESHRALDVRENMRECVYFWAARPYWQLLEGCVNDEDGDAKDVQKYITTHACLEVDSDSPRGLERQICPKHHAIRKQQQEDATHAVLSGDFRLKYEEHHSDDEVWKRLRHVSKEHSRGAKALARKLGKADEVAVKRETSSEKAVEYIEELKEKLKNGSLRVQRETSTSSASNGPKSKTNSPKAAFDPLSSTDSQESISKSLHSLSRSLHKKDKNKKVPKAPIMRFPSFSSKSKKQQHNHAADLFHEIDMKGKTKRSSPWKSLKKKITKTVHSTSTTTTIPTTRDTTSASATATIRTH